MNRRIEELMKQAGGNYMVTFADDTETRPSKIVSVDFDPPETFEKFAELIVKECAKVAFDDWCEGTNESSSEMAILKHFGVE